MPIYSYHCDSCSFSQDFLQELSAPPLKACPKCHAETFHKTLTAPAFHLKGSGWYATDYKEKKQKANDSTEQNTTDTKTEKPVPEKAESTQPAIPSTTPQVSSETTKST